MSTVRKCGITHRALVGLVILASLLGASFQQVLAVTYTESFDTASNWTCVGAGCTSYDNHLYANPSYPQMTFSSLNALRETAGTQDGFPRTHSGAYAWRLRNVSGSTWQVRISSGGVGDFSVWVRRWDGDPDTNYAVEYSTNNGGSWTAVLTINNAWLGNTSNWKQVTGTINTPNGAGDSDDILIRIRAASAGERLMVDDFEMTDYAGGDMPPTVASTTPENGATGVPENTTVTINFSEAVSTLDLWYTFSCNGSPISSSADGTGSQRIITPAGSLPLGATCTVTVLADRVNDLDGTPDPMPGNYVLTFTVTNGSCGPAPMPISSIQGSGAVSPEVGNIRTVEGIVVGDYQASGELGGFFVQEQDAQQDGNPATSEGIFVYATNAVVVGNRVSVTGRVAEYDYVTGSGSTLTELTNVTSVIVCGSGYSVTPASIDLPLGSVDDLERYEGMLVTFTDPLVVGDNYYLGRFGMIGLTDFDYGIDGRAFQFTHNNLPSVSGYSSFLSTLALHTVILDDGSRGQNPDPIIYPGTGLTASNTLRAGQLVSGLTGVLDYCDDSNAVTWDVEAYRLRPVGQVTFSGNPRPLTPEAVGGAVRVASANVLNFFNGDGQGGGFPTPRGAENLTEFNRQYPKLVAELAGLDADIIALMEIENDDYSIYSALDDLVGYLNDAMGAGTYAYLTPANASLNTDQIRVDIIYRPAVVTPVGTPTFYQSGAVFSRPPLVARFNVNGTSESFWVVANHFKSKGCTDATGADLDQGDGQGCYNARRTTQAQTLLAYINSTLIPLDPDVIIVGDLNAYRLEDPIRVFTDGGLVDLLFARTGISAYSYLYDGLSGYLDHALATASLAARVVNATEWHINGDEPAVLDYNTNYKSAGQIVSLYAPDAYRAADHDPLLVGVYPADYSDQLASYGRAVHINPTGGRTVWLGPSAVTDDTSFSEGADDATDDGVQRAGGQWRPGANGGAVTILVNGTATTGYVSGWIDWTRDGDYNDADEQIFVNLAVSRGMPLTQTFFIPDSAGIGSGPRTYRAIFRVYPTIQTMAPPSSTGIASDGEVESYVWSFGPTAITLVSLTASSGDAREMLFVALLSSAVALIARIVWRRID